MSASYPILRELREMLDQIVRFELGKENWIGKWSAGGLYANTVQDSDISKLLQKISWLYND